MPLTDKISTAVLQQVRKAVVGKDVIISKVLMAMLAGGHILIEDIPGVGKTTMALAFSKAMALQYRRVQFTPDTLPGDITGFSIYNRKTDTFEYKPGAAMCNLLLADEINRTSSRTQAALLEVMEEGSITVDGQTHPTPQPFVVRATQNPAGSAGTQLLPESQLDRFMLRVTMGYPSLQNEIAILRNRRLHVPLDSVEPVAGVKDLLAMRRQAQEVYISDELYEYIARLADESRRTPQLELGISPRGVLALAAMSRSCAYLLGRDYVVPEDVQEMFFDVCGHRVVLSAQARMENANAAQVLDALLGRVKAPKLAHKRG